MKALPHLRGLLPYLREHRRGLLWGLLCLLLTTALSVAGPWVLRHAIDDLQAAVTRQKLWAYAGLLLFLVVLEGLFRYQMRMVLIGKSRAIEYTLRNVVFSHLAKLSARYYQGQRVGDLMSRASNDLSAVRMVLGPGIMYTANTLATFAGTLVLMFSISPKLLGLALVPLLFVSFLVRYFGRRIHDRFEAVQAQLAEMNAVVQENLSGVRVVRAYAQEPHEMTRFAEVNRELMERNRRLIRMFGSLYPGIQLLMGLGAVLVLWLGGRMVVAGTISLGEFVAFGAYLTMLHWPMIALGWVVNLFERGEASMGRINEILRAEPEIRDADGATSWTKPIAGAVELRALTFAYGDGPPVLHDIDLRVEAGQTVAVVGPTGSGKSTLVSLLPRLYDAPPGTVFVDGHDVRTIPLRVLRGAVGFVPQETFLFSDTVRENIAFGLPSPDPARIEWAAGVAQLASEVASFPKGYETFVGERGITLSGGQKQRTALARALAIDPRILVLDDALSSVDTYTEEEILKGLAAVMKTRTTFLVSHRISTVKGADLIVVLREGRIVERGTHDELVAQGGFYADLHRRQLLEEEMEKTRVSATFHEEDPLAKQYDRKLLWRLLTYLRPYKLAVAASFLLIVAMAGLDLVGPWLTKEAIDHHIAQGDSAGLRRLALFYLAALLAAFVVRFLQVFILQMTGQKIMRDIRRQIYSHLQSLHVGYFDKNPVGRLMTRVTTDVDAVNELFTSGVVTVFGDLFTLFGIMGVMVAMNWRLALVTFSVIPFFFVVTNWFRKGSRTSFREVRTWVARMNAFLQENLTGMGVVQLFRREERNERAFADINQKHADANMAQIFYYAVFYPAIELLAAVAIALILLYGGGRVLTGALTLGALVAFVQYSERFWRPISDLSEKFNILQQAMASSERIFGLLDTPLQVTTRPAPVRLPDVRGEVSFENVSFAYTDDQWVLQDIDFAVAPGKSVALVGATGAGKTSIISLLARFYDVQKGRVLLDGVDVRDLDPAQLRASLALVLQDVHLFSGTIASNIRLGSPISDARVEEAARAVHAHRFIERLPQGYATEVKERGATLSVGQKQLLSFARALAHDPRVLILDEATSSVDTETETLIQDALRVLLQGRTAIVIAHRLSTIQHVDEILVLHKGRVRERGTHQALLAERGLYWRLYQLQYKEQELRAGPPRADVVTA